MNQKTKGLLALAGIGLGGWMLYRHLAHRYSFRDRVVLITGGSRGLGLVMARQLARQGAHLALLARDAHELDRAKKELARYGNPPVTMACDITKAEQVNDAVKRVIRALGPIDVLINNAGIIQVGPISRMTRADFEQAMETNFWGAFNTIEAVVPGMRERSDGRIINISSIGGKISVPHMIPYCVSKFALVGYSNGLRAELANNGITVTTVCPGLMRTGSPRNADFKGQHDEEYAWFKISSSLPLLTISAEHAAADIIAACRGGRAEVVLSLPAKLAVSLHHAFPEWTANIISLANRLMPRPGNSGNETYKGKESETVLTRSMFAVLTDRAAVQNNEFTTNGNGSR